MLTAATPPAAPPPTTRPKLFPWLRNADNIHAPHIPHPALIAAGIIAAIAIYFVMKERANRRDNQVDRVLATMSAVLGVHGNEKIVRRAGWGHKAVRWQHGKLVRVSVGYPKHCVAHPKARAEMQIALTDLLGEPVALEWEIRKGGLVMTVIGEPDDEDPGTMRQLRQVFAHALDDAKVTAEHHDTDGQITQFTVTYGPTHVDADETWRAKIDGIVCAKTARAWVSAWSPSQHTVTYKTRAELPSMILHPCQPIADKDSLPFGVAVDGTTVAWDLSESPHCLVVGRAGRGKSVVIRGLAMEACRAGRSIDVRIVDPKKISLLALRGHPGISEFAVTETDMVDTIHRVFLEVEDRNSRYFDNLATKEELCHQRLLLIVDETWELIRRLNAAHTASGAKGKIHPAIEDLFAIARTGREIGIHLLAGMQRPDASMLSGEGRNNFGVRIALGGLDQHAAKMVGGEGLVTTKARGQAELIEEGEPSILCQAYWTPDPSERLSPAEAECLAALGAVQPVSTIQTPLPAVLSGNDAVTTCARLSGNDAVTTPGNGLPPPLADEQIARIQALRAGGATYRAIADQLGVSVKAAHKYGSQEAQLSLQLPDGKDAGPVTSGRPRLHVVPNGEM